MRLPTVSCLFRVPKTTKVPTLLNAAVASSKNQQPYVRSSYVETAHFAFWVLPDTVAVAVALALWHVLPPSGVGERKLSSLRWFALIGLLMA